MCDTKQPGIATGNQLEFHKVLNKSFDLKFVHVNSSLIYNRPRNSYLFISTNGLFTYGANNSHMQKPWVQFEVRQIQYTNTAVLKQIKVSKQLSFIFNFQTL